LIRVLVVLGEGLRELLRCEMVAPAPQN